MKPSKTTALSTVVRRDQVVRRLHEAEHALSFALGLDQVRLVLDVAAAQQVFAQRQRLGEEVIGHAHAIKVHALARLGDLLKEMPKAQGGQKGGRGRKIDGSRREPSISPPSLRELGIDKRTSMLAQQLAALPTETRRSIAQRELKLGEAVRRARQAHARAVAPTLSRPSGLFDVIVIDPPWQYDRQPTTRGLRGQCDYATMTLEELRALELPAAPDCVLWLWTTNSFMRDAYTLADTWGFTVKTILTWDKVHLGLGDWLRNVTEHCLFAVRGRPPVTLTNQTTLLRETRRAHSQKPEAFYALVESLCPGRKCEYFSRSVRAGWDAWGLEAPPRRASV